MPQRLLHGILATAVLVVASGCATHNSTPPTPATAQPYTGKVLVLMEKIPKDVDHEVIGPISVYKRGYGGTGEAFRMLGDKGRAMGANAIVEARVTLAQAFPARLAPHGRGIAVHVKNPKQLEEIAATVGRWE
jgi:uncharacterized protein YbjQ (UPF0145 family)